MSDTSTEARVLKPCPFCGGEASDTGVIRYDHKHEAFFKDGTRITEAFFCNCISCGVTNRGMLGHQTREKAITAWNRRSELSGKDAERLDAQISAYSIPVSSKRFDNEITVQRARQIEGPPLWAVRLNGECLNKSGEWEWEPMPSSRDDEFLARCRFATHTEAIDAAIQKTKEQS
ncbi:MAG: Lar family restriction alleviation protein [Pseudomonadota bacterium]